MKEHEETMKNIATYEDILNNYDSMAEVIMKELDQIKKEYGSKRKTSIENAEEAVYEEKKMEETEVCFLMDRFGYMRLIDKNAYERNKGCRSCREPLCLYLHEYGQDLYLYRYRQAPQ